MGAVEFAALCLGFAMCGCMYETIAVAHLWAEKKRRIAIARRRWKRGVVLRLDAARARKAEALRLGHSK